MQRLVDELVLGVFAALGRISVAELAPHAAVLTSPQTPQTRTRTPARTRTRTQARATAPAQPLPAQTAPAEPSPVFEEPLTVSDPQLLLDALERGEAPGTGDAPASDVRGARDSRGERDDLPNAEATVPAAPASEPADKVPMVALRADEQALRTANGSYVIRRKRAPAAA